MEIVKDYFFKINLIKLDLKYEQHICLRFFAYSI